MPDISMCGNKTCPMRLNCYRYMATPNPDWQTYSSFTPVYNSVKKILECEWFIDYEGGKKK